MIPEWDSLSSNTGGSLCLKFTVFFMFSVTFPVTFEVVSRHFWSRSAWYRIYRRAYRHYHNSILTLCFFLSLFSVASVALLKLSPASLQPTQNGRLCTSCSSLCYHWSYQRLVVALLSRKWASRSKFYLRKDERNTEIWTWSWCSQISIFPRLWSSSKVRAK